MLQALLRGEGLETGRLHVATLMKKMGIGDLSPPEHLETSTSAQGLSLSPAQAGGHPAQPSVGNGPDLHPIARGFVYLCAVVDRFSRRVLSWRLSITMEAAFCIEAVKEALARHGAGQEAVVHPNGEAALQHIQDNPVDLLITDFMMPKMTGLELATAVRAIPAKSDLPIILVSGAQTSIGRAHPALFDVVLDKPYSLEKLLSIEENLMREGRSGSSQPT